MSSKLHNGRINEGMGEKNLFNLISQLLNQERITLVTMIRISKRI